MIKNTVGSTESKNGSVGRPSRPFGQLWQVPVFMAGIAALAVVAAASTLNLSPDEDPLDHDLAVIRSALEKPGVPPEHIVALAEGTGAHIGRDPERAGEAHFLLGTVYLRLAERKPADKRKDELEKASMYLELAELRGVPTADRARLMYLRGKVLIISGGNLERAIDLLSKSLPAGADNPAEGYGYLVQALLSKTPPDVDAALDANLGQLEVCDDEAMFTRARMLRGELLLKKDMRVEAIKALDAIGPKAPQEIRLKARYLQAKAAMEEGMWGRAIPWWTELLAQAEMANVPGGKGRMFYNLGLCCANLEPPAHDQEAIAAWREAQLFGGEEAQAAAIRLAELRLRAGNTAQALDHLKESLEKVTTSADYTNSLVNLARAQLLLEETCRMLDSQRDTEHFLQAAELYKKVAAPGAADELIGQAAEERGRDLSEQAKAQPNQAGVWVVQAQDAFQKAALAFEQAANTRPAAERADPLWRCIECYRLAEKPEQATEVLKKFVELPVSSRRKAEAWFTLAQMQARLKLPDARASYTQCVAFNEDAFTARALLQLADIALEANNPADAEAVLQQVKSPPKGLIADRASHELAMLKLADLYHQQKKFDKAAIECKELIKQYPAQPNLLAVRAELASCYTNLAEQAQANAKVPDGPSLKQYYQQEWLKNLEAARDTYQELVIDLEAKADELKVKSGKTLSPAEESTLRRALFGVADSYFNLPTGFEEAFRSYRKLFERYRSEPEGLWACYREFTCWQRAIEMQRSDSKVFQEAAESDVEYCLLHFEDYNRSGAFRRDTDEKTRWKACLENWQGQLSRASKRRG
jgi:predicted negative regulator of RcsB-dependent stress response